MLKIYTRTGDRGQTSLFGGKRVSKDSVRIEAVGSVDELNSAIGVTVSNITHSANLKKELIAIQHDLFEIGAKLATPGIKKQESKNKHLEIRVDEFEDLIDSLTKDLPELRNFILPGGGSVGSLLHFARTVCRRAERRIIALDKKETVDPDVLKYFNRLSDLLFTLARVINMKEKKKETTWNPTKY